MRTNYFGFLCVEWEYAIACEIRYMESTLVKRGNLAITLRKMKPSNE